MKVISAYDKHSGFTLVEILVVVAIVGILGAIAIPSYFNYVNRSELRTVASDLNTLALNFENRYQRMLSYPNQDFADTAALKAEFTSWTTDKDDYVFSSTGTAATYTISATGTQGGTLNCVLSIDNAGNKTLQTKASATPACEYVDTGVW